MKTLVSNASDEEQVKKAKDHVRRGREQELADIYTVLSTRQGRRFYWKYLSFCKVFETSFNHSGSITAFNEGMRNVGLKLLSDMNEACPDVYAVIQKESKEN